MPFCSLSTLGATSYVIDLPYREKEVRFFEGIHPLGVVVWYQKMSVRFYFRAGVQKTDYALTLFTDNQSTIT